MEGFDWKLAAVTFGSIFLAELGDKTQLATMMMSAQARSPWAVFVGSASALVCTSLLGVLAGEVVGRYIPEIYIKVGAGLGFILIGSVLLWNTLLIKV